MSKKKAPASSSPGIPKPITTMVSSEANKDLQTLISKAISIALQPLIVKIDSLEQKINSLQQQMTEQKQSSQEFKHDLHQSNQQISRNEAKIKSHAKKFEACEREIIYLQMERARYALRLQNVPEKPGELKDQISTLLAPMANISEGAMNSQIESVYRISTVYTKNKNLPKEVQLRFTSKNLRDEVLRKSNETPLMIGNTKINILKDVPFLARQKRRKYKVLTKQLLMDNKIRFTWCTHDGIIFGFKGQSFKLTSELKLKEFMKKYGKELGHKESDSSDVEPTETTEEESERGEPRGATGVAEITTKLRKYSFRERDK